MRIRPNPDASRPALPAKPDTSWVLYTYRMRSVSLVIALCVSIHAQVPTRIELARRVTELAAREPAEDRADTLLRLAAILQMADPTFSQVCLNQAIAFLRQHPEVPATRTLVRNLFQLDAAHADQVLRSRSDRAQAYSQLIEYHLEHQQLSRAIELLRSALLKPEDKILNSMAAINGVGVLAQSDPQQARRAVSGLIALFEEDTELGVNQVVRITADFPGNVSTMSTRDTLLYSLAVLTRRLNEDEYRTHRPLFASWSQLLDEDSKRIARPQSRTITFADGRKLPGQGLIDPEKIPLADALRAVRGKWTDAEQLTIRLVELKRNPDEVAAAAALYLDALEKGPNNPDSYDYLARLMRSQGIKLGANNPSIQARLALAELAAHDSSYDFTLPDLSGKPVKLSEQRGKVVLLNFWATWCGPCREELPMLNQLATEYREHGLVILAISDEDRALVQSVVEQHKYSVPMLIDSGRKVMGHYGVQGIPRTLILNRVGERIADFTESRERDLRQVLAAAGIEQANAVTGK